MQHLLSAAATLLLLTGNLAAQNAQFVSNKTTQSIASREDLLKNPDIVWMGETYSIFLLDETDVYKTENKKHLEQMGIKNNPRVHVLPIKNLDLRKTTSLYPDIYQLTYLMLDADNVKKGSFYADANCTQKLATKDVQRMVSSIDSIITIDPTTKATTTQVVVNDLNFEDIKSYQAKHLVYFNQKTNTFGTLMEAFAPIRYMYDENGNYVDKKPMFWVKIENQSTIQDLNNPDINWARRTSRAFNFDEIKTIKSNKTVEQCMQLMMETIVKNAKTEDVRNTMGTYEQLKESEKQQMLNHIDTIITFDPKTSEESVRVVKYAFDAKNVQRLRFMQEWYWDYKQHKMVLHTMYFAPIIQRFDDNGKVINEGPMFWKPAK